jgi:Fe-S-cluster containining protein
VRPLPLATAFDRTRDSSFSYECRACGRCCQGKAIPVNPYEVARIAEHLGTTTTDVLRTKTENGGAILAGRDDDWCAFFEAGRGCTIHAARPLACRLYPLGRYIDASGKESFAEVERHPESEGVHDGASRATVADWLEAQGVAPYLDATARYLDAMRALAKAFAARDDAAEAASAIGDTPPLLEDNLLDLDAVVTRICEERGEPVPTSLDARVAIHVAFLAALR